MCGDCENLSVYNTADGLVGYPMDMRIVTLFWFLGMDENAVYSLNKWI